jgi:hypothetical protein
MYETHLSSATVFEAFLTKSSAHLSEYTVTLMTVV